MNNLENTVEVEDTFSLADDLTLLKVFIQRTEPIHSCGECGIPTSFPGEYCEVCSNSLSVEGSFVAVD